MNDFQGTDRYVVRSELAWASSLFEAWDRTRQCVVCLWLEPWGAPDSLASFKARYRFIRSLGHASFPTFHAIEVETGTAFIVGDVLLHPAAVWLETGDANDLMRQLADLVRGVQERGASLGEIRLEHLAVTEAGRVVLWDLSLLQWGEPSVASTLAGLGDSLGAPVDPAEGAVAPPSPWVGRVSEMDRVQRGWQRVVSGRGVVVRVHGIVGIGKSRFVKTFLEALDGSHWGFLGVCSEHEQVPLRALDAVIDAFLVAVEALPQSDREGLREAVSVLASERADEEAVTDAGAAVLMALSRRRPVVVALDEIQWGDRESARIVIQWMQGLARRRVMWMVAGGGSGAFESFLLHDPRWVRLETIEVRLGSLNNEDTMHLAQRLGVPEEARAWVTQESRGHPAVAAALAVAVQREPDALEALNFEAVALRHLADLTAPERQILVVVALASRPLPVVLVRRVAEVVDAEGGVSKLSRQRWVNTHALGATRMVQIAHERLVGPILETVVPEAQARLHRRLARELRRYGWADPTAMMHHHLAGGERDQVGPAAMAAAKTAMDAFAFEQAVAAYKVALAFIEPEKEVEVRYALADAQIRAGRSLDAAQTLQDLAETRTGVEQLQCLRRAAEQWVCAGAIDRGLQALQPLLASLGLPSFDEPSGLKAVSTRWWTRVSDAWGGETPERLAERVDTAWVLGIAFQMLDPARARAFHTIAMAEAARHHGPVRAFRSRCLEMSVVSTESANERRGKDFVALKSEAAALGEPYLTGLCTLAEGLSAYMDGAYRAAQRHLTTAHHTLDAAPAPFERAVCELFRLRSMVYLGDLARASEERERVRRRAESRGNGLVLACLGADVMALLDLARGRPDQVKRHGLWMMEEWDGGKQPLQQFFALRADVLRLLYLQEPAQSHKAFITLSARVENAGLDHNRVTRLHLLHLGARVDLAMGRAESAASRARAMSEFAHPFARPFSALVRGAVHFQHGDAATSVAELAEAERWLTRSELRLHAAVAERARGLISNDARAVARAEGWLVHAGVEDPGAISRVLWAPLD